MEGKGVNMFIDGLSFSETIVVAAVIIASLLIVTVAAIVVKS
jgi:hypothetical protein